MQIKQIYSTYTNMIKHIVFFKLAETAEGKTKKEHALSIKSQLEDLINHVPTLKKIEVGINSEQAPNDNYDLVLYSEFDTMNDLDAYQIHPAHKKVAAYIGKVKTARACVDYEI